jgi:hypothetical protein
MQLTAVLVVVVVFQKRMQRSAAPPPLASKPRWCGLQAMAFTAAECPLYRSIGCVELALQMYSSLSFPPVQRRKLKLKAATFESVSSYCSFKR